MRTLLFVALAIVVSAVEGYANRHGGHRGDGLALALFAGYAGYCAQNFVRCREVHCAIAAPGFAIAAVLMLLRLLGVAHYAYGLPWIVFLASACLGFCAQWLYQRRTGTTYLRS
ncbi:MAG: hypothetical protein WBV67_00580 [Candidatus Cybelea sp.]